MTQQDRKFHEWFIRMYKEVQDCDDRQLSELRDIVKIHMQIRENLEKFDNVIVDYDEEKYSEKTIIESKEFENPL